MKTKILFVVIVLVLVTSPGSTTWAGDKEWRRFGEAAAILWGVKALTGWDPVEKIIEYPRRHLAHENKLGYHQPTNVYIQQYPSNDKISAFPQRYSSESSYSGSAQPAVSVNYPSDEFDLPIEKSPEENYSNQGISSETVVPPPNKENSKPPVVINKHIEGNYEVETRRIWIAPHWEKKTIEGHWKGDTWVETHTEKKWVKGKWEEVENRRLLEDQN